MGIVVKGASRKFTSEDLIAAAVGMTDARGNRFETITLDWNPRKKNTDFAKTRGFEDAVIERTDRGLTIDYRLPGCAVWRENELTGQYSAVIPFTRHNVAVLGSHYGEALWLIREPRYRKMAEAVYAKIRDGMTQQQRKEDDKRIKAQFTSMFDNPDQIPQFDQKSKGPGDEQAAAGQMVELDKKMKKLEDMQEKLDEERAYIDNKVEELAKKGVLLHTYSPEYLTKLNITQIRKLAKSVGFSPKPWMNKDSLMKAILQKQSEPLKDEDFAPAPPPDAAKGEEVQDDAAPDDGDVWPEDDQSGKDPDDGDAKGIGAGKTTETVTG